MVIGNDLLWNMGMNIEFSNEQLVWDGDTIPMKTDGTIIDKEVCHMIYSLHTDAPILKEAEKRANQILDADYLKVDIDEMVNDLEINNIIMLQLKETLKKFLTLFGGGLGKLGEDYLAAKINLKEGMKPNSSTYYTMPKAHEKPAKKEIDCMVAIGILKKLKWHDDTPWAAASFCQPKTTGDLQIVTDFWKMNKAIEREPFPIPRVLDIMHKLGKFKSVTALDLSQGFYTIPLDEESQKICTTVTPWGKYAYLQMPMGIACAPDMFQLIMNDMFGDLDYVLFYIDDILIIQQTDESEEEHLQKLETVLARLKNAGFCVNLHKSFFMQKEIKYLGYQLTSTGLKAQPKKLKAIDHILTPTNPKQLKQFISMINFYHNI